MENKNNHEYNDNASVSINSSVNANHSDFRFLIKKKLAINLKIQEKGLKRIMVGFLFVLSIFVAVSVLGSYALLKSSNLQFSKNYLTVIPLINSMISRLVGFSAITNIYYNIDTISAYNDLDNKSLPNYLNYTIFVTDELVKSMKYFMFSYPKYVDLSNEHFFNVLNTPKFVKNEHSEDFNITFFDFIKESIVNFNSQSSFNSSVFSLSSYIRNNIPIILDWAISLQTQIENDFKTAFDQILKTNYFLHSFGFYKKVFVVFDAFNRHSFLRNSIYSKKQKDFYTFFKN